MSDLSERQLNALTALAKRGPGSSYGLRLNIGTLKSLVARGLAAKKSEVGAFFSPRTAIEWRITDAGRAALTKKD